MYDKPQLRSSQRMSRLLGTSRPTRSGGTLWTCREVFLLQKRLPVVLEATLGRDAPSRRRRRRLVVTSARASRPLEAGAGDFPSVCSISPGPYQLGPFQAPQKARAAVLAVPSRQPDAPLACVGESDRTVGPLFCRRKAPGGNFVNTEAITPDLAMVVSLVRWAACACNWTLCRCGGIW